MHNGKKIVIVMPAYNVGKKIISVFERVPRAVWDRNASFIVVNDGSADDTQGKIEEARSRWGERISAIQKPKNEGYAQAQKDGFAEALRRGADIIVLLHSDGQCAPEELPKLLRPLEEGTADIVQGSRMMNKRDALKGGMPVYKFIANIALSTVENMVFGLDFAEYHSGYMLYARKALETIPFAGLSDTFHFDGEMLLVGSKLGLRARQIATPTLYADEISHVKNIRYGLSVIGIMVKYLLGKYDFHDSSASSRQSKKASGTMVLGGVVLTLALLTAVFGYTGYSLHGFLDAMGTMPPAVSYAIGNGFKDHVTDLRNEWGDPTGEERYLWFPPLYSLVVSAFVSESSSLPPPQQATFGSGIIAALAVVLASVVFYKIATMHERKLGDYGAALIAAFLVIVLRSMWTMLARPEVLESVFLLAGFLLALRTTKTRVLIFGFGVILGLMAATHPVGTAFFGAFMGMVFFFRFEWRRGIAYCATAALVGCVVFVLAMQLSPFGIRETYEGMVRHGVFEMERVGSSMDRAFAFIKSPYAVLYGILMAGAVVLCTDFYRRYRVRIRSPIFFVLCAASIAILMVYFVVLGVKTYYAILFSFLIFGVMVYYLVHAVRARWVRYPALVFVVLFAALSLRPALAFPEYMREGVTIAEARGKFAPVAERYPDAEIFISADMWVLSEDYERMHYVADIKPEHRSERPLVVVLDQNHSYNQWSPSITPPREAEGCPLKEDHFVKRTPEFYGVKLSNSMPGYGFAVYVCE